MYIYIYIHMYYCNNNDNNNNNISLRGAARCEAISAKDSLESELATVKATGKPDAGWKCLMAHPMVTHRNFVREMSRALSSCVGV